MYNNQPSLKAPSEFACRSSVGRLFQRTAPEELKLFFIRFEKGRGIVSFAVGVSQRVSGDITTTASFLVTFLDLYVKFPGTPENYKGSFRRGDSWDCMGGQALLMIG